MRNLFKTLIPNGKNRSKTSATPLCLSLSSVSTLALSLSGCFFGGSADQDSYEAPPPWFYHDVPNSMSDYVVEIDNIDNGETLAIRLLLDDTVADEQQFSHQSVLGITYNFEGNSESFFELSPIGGGRGGYLGLSLTDNSDNFEVELKVNEKFQLEVLEDDFARDFNAKVTSIAGKAGDDTITLGESQSENNSKTIRVLDLDTTTLKADDHISEQTLSIRGWDDTWSDWLDFVLRTIQLDVTGEDTQQLVSPVSHSGLSLVVLEVDDSIKLSDIINPEEYTLFQIRDDTGTNNFNTSCNAPQFNNADVVTGGDGNDTLKGNAGTDRLLGGEGDDFLFGGDGSDELYGGPGTNKIDGGPGKDTATFDYAPEDYLIEFLGTSNYMVTRFDNFMLVESADVSSVEQLNFRSIENPQSSELCRLPHVNECAEAMQDMKECVLSKPQVEGIDNTNDPGNDDVFSNWSPYDASGFEDDYEISGTPGIDW